MSRKLRSIVAGLSLLVAWPVLADWNPGDGHKMHFPQLPDPNGWDVCLVDEWVGDDFTCGQSGPITDIHFWISWRQGLQGDVPATAWDISIWSDGGGVPGVKLWQFTGGTVVTRPYGVGPQGWVCPATGVLTPNDHTTFDQVNITNIIAPFTQTVGTTYWLVIRANIPAWPNPAVGWKTSVNDPPGPLYQAPAMWSTNLVGWQTVNTGVLGPELHDMAFVITGGAPQEELDFGDASDLPYPTLLASNGARHTIVATVFMGTSIDGEPDGQPTPDAKGDDNDGNDDEDGVVFTTPLSPGGPAAVDVTASVPGFINAWVDFNGNGNWADAGEQIFTNEPVVAGLNSLAFNVPGSATAGMVTYARFRYNTGGGLFFDGPASDGEVEDYEVVIADPVPFLIEFSLDIGSDIELSDPFVNGNEAADPGDVYWWQSTPIVPPGRDGFKDDVLLFGLGIDPFPDPPDAALATAVPVGAGTIQDYAEWFDLDGHDQLDIDLQQVTFPITQFPSQCIYGPDFLLISYDDDRAPGWPVGDVPVAVSSPAGFTYGTTPAADEVIGVNLTVGPLPFPTAAMYSFADELTVHASMAPNPDLTEQEDDDVDSLDIVPDTQQCPFWYLSPDHEAHMGLDPGGIYLITAFGSFQVIDEAFHLGISEDADIDAFEFSWLQSVGGPVLLALLYSVDEDDPLTTFADESGGLDPKVIYGSFMTGFSFAVSDPLDDDIDALTAWWEPLGGQCVCQDVRSLRFHGVPELALGMTCMNGIEPRFGGIQKLEIDLDDASVFGGGVAVNCLPVAYGGVAAHTGTVANTVTITFVPGLPDQSKCTITLDCGAQACVRNLEGDSNRDGATNPVDNNQRLLRFGMTAAAAGAQWDVNVDGNVNPVDNNQTLLRFGNSAPNCP